MKTSRAESSRPWYFFHCSRRRAILGRSCSAGSTLFFEAQPFVMSKGPDRPVINSDPAFGQFSYKTAQSEIRLHPLQQPVPMRANQLAWLVTAHLPRGYTPRFPVPPQPVHRCADRNAKAPRRLVARKTIPFNRQNHTFSKINRIGSRHPCWPPIPALSLNQKNDPLGIPIDSTKPHPALRIASWRKAPSRQLCCQRLSIIAIENAPLPAWETDRQHSARRSVQGTRCCGLRERAVHGATCLSCSGLLDKLYG